MSTSRAGSRSEAGFTLIDLLFAVALVATLSTLAIPGLMRARGAADASSALGTMRVLNSAQLSYAITCGLGFYSPDFPTLGVKPPGVKEAFVTPEMSRGPTFIKSRYNFSMAGISVAGSPTTCNGLPAGRSAAGYALVADPLDISPPARFFGTNADGVIYEHTATLSATMPETGSPPAGKPIN